MSMQARSLVDMIQDDIDKKNLKIPSIPESLQQLQRLSNDEHATVNDIAKVVNADPAIAGQVMTFANSPFIRPPNPITNLDSAISRLGLPYTVSLSYGVAVATAFRPSNRSLSKRTNAIWNIAMRSAQATGIVCQVLGQKQFADELMLSLFHNVGALALIYNIDHVPEFIEHYSNHRNLSVALAQMNEKVTQLVAESWGLPEPTRNSLNYVTSTAPSSDRMVTISRAAIGLAIKNAEVPFTYPEPCSPDTLRSLLPHDEEFDTFLSDCQDRLRTESSSFA